METWFDQKMPVDYRYTLTISGEQWVIWRPGAREGAEGWGQEEHWQYANTWFAQLFLTHNPVVGVVGHSTRPLVGLEAIDGDVTLWVSRDKLDSALVEVL